MARYLLKRMLSGLLALFLFLTLVFFLTQILIRGDWVLANMPFAPPEMKAAVREQLGLDDPLGVRYVRWLGDLSRGQLGRSYTTGEPVLQTIRAVLPGTLLVLIPAGGLAFVLGLVLGTAAAWRGPGLISDSATVLAVLLYAMFPPALAFGLEHLMGQSFRGVGSWQQLVMTQYMRNYPEFPVDEVYRRMLWLLVGAVVAAVLLLVVVRRVLRWRLSPLVGVLVASGLWVGGWYLSGIAEQVTALLPLLSIPFIIFTLLTLGDLLVVTRTSVTDTLHDQYVITAWAKGVSDRDVRDLHAARNALLPVVSKMVVSIPYLMAGLVIIESATRVRGIGSMLFYATNMRDIPLMLGALVVIGLLTLVLRLALDVITALLDPRIRVETALEVIRSA